MTKKEVISAVKSRGMTCKWIGETQEFRVNFPNGKEATAYYTSDADDAIATAGKMFLEGLRRD